MGDAEKTVPAPKGKPAKGAKTTVDVVIPVTITPTKVEFVLVLDKTGAAPAAYPILSFEVKGPPGWFYEVQVCRKDASKFTEGPGLTGSWDKTKPPKDRVPVPAFSSWTNGEQALKLDGAGKATYKLPLDWWKDQARQARSAFVEDYFYRALGFKASGSPPRFSSANGAAAPSVKVHNNLVSLKLTDVGYTNGGIRKPERVEVTVREPNTTDMYTIVQWKSGTNQVWGGTATYSTVVDYGLTHLINAPEWAVDSLTTNPRPSFFGGSSGPTVSADGKTASGTDNPGGAMSSSDKVDYLSWDFETRVHLNFEVPAAVTISKQEGSAPVYDKVIGVVGPPEPFILDSGTWKVRILQETQSDGTITVSQPDTYAGPPAPSGGGRGCFIATAAYGSEMAPDVQLLRDIRENVLRQTVWGRRFFEEYWKYYYRISTPIADEMNRDENLRRIVRWSIVDPWTCYLKLALRRPRWEQIDFDRLDPVVREFLAGLRHDMDRWLSAIEVPTTFADSDAVEAVKELNIVLDLVRPAGDYLEMLAQKGALPLRYVPELEATLVDLLRRAGRTPEEIQQILFGTSGSR